MERPGAPRKADNFTGNYRPQHPVTDKHGTSTYLEVLTAKQGLLSAQLTQVADRFDEIQGIINLYQALGGGRE